MTKTLLRIAVLSIATISTTIMFAANTKDATLLQPLRPYVPTEADLSYNAVTAGDMAVADVFAVGRSLQYTGVVLNGDGVNANAMHPFIKVQEQNSDGNFEFGACYLGNNGSAGSFGLGFFALQQPFKSAHLTAVRSGSTVLIQLSHVNGGALPDQDYSCSGAPTPPGDKVGVNGFADNTARLDNFSSCLNLLDTFSYLGPLSTSGNWNDVAPGMHANTNRALGGPLALSFWIPTVSCGAR